MPSPSPAGVYTGQVTWVGQKAAFQKIRRQDTKQSRFVKSCNRLNFALLTVRQGVEVDVLSKHTVSVEQSSLSDAEGVVLHT